MPDSKTLQKIMEKVLENPEITKQLVQQLGIHIQDEDEAPEPVKRPPVTIPASQDIWKPVMDRARKAHAADFSVEKSGNDFIVVKDDQQQTFDFDKEEPQDFDTMPMPSLSPENSEWMNRILDSGSMTFETPECVLLCQILMELRTILPHFTKESFSIGGS